MTEKRTKGATCPVCGGRTLHYANCPDAGAETYALSAAVLAIRPLRCERQSERDGNKVANLLCQPVSAINPFVLVL